MHTNVAGFLPDSVTYNVNPNLWILTSLEEYVTNSRPELTGDAVFMLEYLHRLYPHVGDERKYVNLLVDMKTKVSCRTTG